MQNSDFRKDARGRLMRTASSLGTLTYGTTDAAERAGARVRRIHSMLGATGPATGERCGVDEPELLLWMHCAEVGSYLDVARRSDLGISDAQAGQHLEEQRESARPVGLDPARVPASTAGLAACCERVRPEPAAGPEAREVDDFLRSPRCIRCSYRRAHCCGGAWPHSRTPHCLPAPTSCTAAPSPHRGP